MEEENDDEENKDDDEPLMSGSGKVVRECSEEQLDSWSDIMNKWKDVSSRPKQVTPLIRKQVTKATSYAGSLLSAPPLAE